MSDKINNIKNDIEGYDRLSDIDIGKIVDVDDGYAYIIAKHSKNKIKTNQIRKFFDVIKKIEKSDDDWNTKRVQFYLLKPRLANAFGRKRITKEFYDVIIAAMNIVDIEGDPEVSQKNFEYFVNLYESIIAYHKYFGGQ